MFLCRVGAWRGQGKADLGKMLRDHVTPEVFIRFYMVILYGFDMILCGFHMIIILINIITIIISEVGPHFSNIPFSLTIKVFPVY